MSAAQARANNQVRLNDNNLFDISIGRRVLKSEIVKDGVYDVFSASVFEPFGKTSHSVLDDFSKPSVLWGIDGDWMVNYQKAEKPFNPTDHCGVIRVLDETVVNPRYFVYPLLKAGEIERFSRSNRASTERVKSLSIMLPDIDTQNEVAQQLISMENEIAELKNKMKDCVIRKQNILDKYLK
jgi:restriction endonuclease S subunit